MGFVVYHDFQWKEEDIQSILKCLPVKVQIVVCVVWKCQVMREVYIYQDHHNTPQSSQWPVAHHEDPGLTTR